MHTHLVLMYDRYNIRNPFIAKDSIYELSTDILEDGGMRRAVHGFDCVPYNLRPFKVSH